MPVRRKVFRIEQMGPVGTPAAAFAATGMSAKQQQEILAELKAMRELMERRVAPTTDDSGAPTAAQALQEHSEAIQQALTSTKEAIAALHAAAFCSSGQSRVTRELTAIGASAELATQRIIDAVESIDEAAKNLTASLQREQEQSLALDIQDQVLRVFEACNFQDLHGQRIAKALTTLRFIEARITQMMDLWGGLNSFRDDARANEWRARRAALKGPKLDQDRGHFTQDEIDIMFATG